MPAHTETVTQSTAAAEAERGGRGQRCAQEERREKAWPIRGQACSRENPLCWHGCDRDAQVVSAKRDSFLDPDFCEI